MGLQQAYRPAAAGPQPAAACCSRLPAASALQHASRSWRAAVGLRQHACCRLDPQPRLSSRHTTLNAELYISSVQFSSVQFSSVS